MKQTNEHSKFFAMRTSVDSSGGEAGAWDGVERRASYRAAAERFENDATAAFDTKAIFRETIVRELKDGKISPGRRRRIIRYAARMGLSAVEAGHLLSRCRDQAMSELDACKETPTLRMHIPDTDDHSTATYVMIAIAGAVLFNVAIVLLFA